MQNFGNDSLHLDLGCGVNPRNPFNAQRVFGLDLVKRKEFESDEVKFVTANLVLEKIPFPDNYFDSVSAYDFLEHIPRMIVLNSTTELPFVNLMSEIYRVLKPNGKFYALTPFFPMESAFVDPTHVNFISANTHKYFSRPHLWGQMYGYKGDFEAFKVEKVNFDLELESKLTLKVILKTMLSFFKRNSKQHILWHLKAIK